MSARAKSTGSKTGKRKKRFRVARPDAVQAPCGEDLRHWAERVPIDAVNEILFTGFETVALRQKRLEMGRLEGHILFAVDGTGRDNCRDETTENGKKRRVALVGSVLAPWGKVPERTWVRLIWAQLVCGSESWRNAKGQNLKRA